MAYVKGPLMSESASGQIAKEIIFQTYNGRTYAKTYAVPGNTPGSNKPNQTPAQLAVQALTKSLMQNWKTIAPADQATWDALSEPKRISRVNAYLRYNYARNAVGLDPTDVYPPVTTPPAQFLFLTYFDTAFSLEDWHSTHLSGGALTLTDGNIYSTPDVIEISYQGQDATSGTYDVTNLQLLKTLYIPDAYPQTTPDFTNNHDLQTVNMAGGTLVNTPDFSNCPDLQNVNLSYNGFESPPDFHGLAEILTVDLSFNNLTEVDSVFIEIAESAETTATGFIDVSGDFNAAPTSASDAARATLSTGTGNWTIAYN